MKQLGRITLGLILVLVGIIVAMLGVFLMVQLRDWTSVGFAVATVLFGLVIILGGLGAIRGERIRDLLYAIFLSLP